MTVSASSCSLPILIQGGMGIAISGWRLARAVAARGHLGVVSGTAIDRVVAARLQEGDNEGHLLRAFRSFPDQALATRVYECWYRPNGLSTPGGYKSVPMFGLNPSRKLVELAIMAAYAEVWLAREEKAGPIGINLLEKIQAPTLPLLYGAILAEVDYVLMGAGIPREIPSHLDSLCSHLACSLRLNVENGDSEELPFDPRIVEFDKLPIRRPRFLAIVSSHVLAMSLARIKGVDGFVIENHTAGGHNAPPRRWTAGEGSDPEYGPRDEPNFDRIRSLGIPFWIAGLQDDAVSLSKAQSMGAEGIQVGTAFAFCSDSGMETGIRKRAIEASLCGSVRTRTEGRGSPTGFPFKTLNLQGTEGGRLPSERKRQTCAHGYLRSAYRKEDGSLGWRCSAEPEAQFVKKGGSSDECVGRRCLCNGLLATAGHPHSRESGGVELPLVTSGEIRNLERFLKGAMDYDANAVIDCLAIPDGPLALP